MSHPTNYMDWDSSPNCDSMTDHEIETLLGSWDFNQAAFPNSVTNPTVGNFADALETDGLELQTLRKLRETRETEIGLLWKLLQIRARRLSTQMVSADADSSQNPVVDPTQEPLPPSAQQILLHGVENVVTNDSLLLLQSDDAIPSSVRGNSREATFEIPRFAEFPTSLSDSTLESADSSTFVHYSYEPASDDQGIRSDGNCSLTPTLTFLSVTDNEGEASTTVSFVNQADPEADRTAAPSSETQTTQVPVPTSESAIVRPKRRRRSFLDLPGVDCFPSNEQVSNFRRGKRRCTDEQRENIKAVRKHGACLNCREGKRQCSPGPLCKHCLKIMEANFDNPSLRIFCIRPWLKENFFWTKWIEFALQDAGENTPADTTSIPGTELTEACDRLQLLVDVKPGTTHSCSPAEFYDLTGEPACELYARRWKSIWDDSKRRQHTRPLKQNCHRMLRICEVLAICCEKGVQPNRIQSLSYPAIGVMTVQLIDWILVARVVAVLVHDFLSTSQWKMIQELGELAEGKIIDYLKWIRSRYPNCPNDSPACRSIRTRTFEYMDFILKNYHCNWTGFHTLIQQLEYENLNDGEIISWCISNDFDLSTDG